MGCWIEDSLHASIYFALLALHKTHGSALCTHDGPTTSMNRPRRLLMLTLQLAAIRRRCLRHPSSLPSIDGRVSLPQKVQELLDAYKSVCWVAGLLSL